MKIVVFLNQRVDFGERQGENTCSRIEVAVEHHRFSLLDGMEIIFEVGHLPYNAIQHFMVHIYSSFSFDSLTDIRLFFSERARKPILLD